MALTADYYSVQQTTYNAIVAGTSTTQLTPATQDMPMSAYLAVYDMAGTLPKSKTLGICTLPVGVIVMSVGFITTASWSTAVIALGTTVTSGKYRAALVHTTPLISWNEFQIPAVATWGVAITTAELVIATNDATADLPTSGIIGFRVQVCHPR